MCDICNAAGYEIEDGCRKCGVTGDVGVYLDGSGCWQCSPKADVPVDAGRVVDAFAAAIARGEAREFNPNAGSAFFRA